MRTLRDILPDCKETKDDFLDRTYWTSGRWWSPNLVLVFKDKSKTGDAEVWSEEKARSYLLNLEGEEHHCIIETEYIEPVKEEELVIEEERVE